MVLLLLSPLTFTSKLLLSQLSSSPTQSIAPSELKIFPCMKLVIFTFWISWGLWICSGNLHQSWSVGFTFPPFPFCFCHPFIYAYWRMICIFHQLIIFSHMKSVILDHHKTALENLGSESLVDENVIKVIDMERSGATIAFDYFKEKLLSSRADAKHQPVLKQFEGVRKLYDYIEDGDLWRWKLQNSKAFSSGLKDLDIEFDARLNPSLFDQLLLLDVDSVISQGMVSLSRKQKLIDACLSRSYRIALGGGAYGSCLAINADAALSELRSELGNQLACKSQNLKLRAIGAVVYKVPELGNDNMLKISLRSLGNEDTTPISQEFGGGGHRNASSFMLSSEQFEQWKV
ncbi:uncharacterized protein LOC129286636 isoform X1 [Prosopis cineraria]|uniref:uncharacterized protein LOC129286636 isoform X1 n=1 Tax=Prosopis cineraria TaxID=364024 RepID=UPI0024100159|nr:uncharacterized protein LOC129286636 isoform X1 [Prosopis cineraria]